MKTDPNIDNIIAKFRQREQAGLEKYGCTTAENPLSLEEWVTHAMEELMDCIIYLERIKSELRGSGEVTDDQIAEDPEDIYKELDW